MHIAIEHEYILTYAKNIALLGEFYESYSDDISKGTKKKIILGAFSGIHSREKLASNTILLHARTEQS